ncbi:hypothetical protein BAMY6639_04700 [Bacillus amyloliquefaciens UMAF6639]|nr:hypothetical protein BAMY6639_04700 [Bacillus amyloliquefaciens UMAF6639]
MSSVYQENNVPKSRAALPAFFYAKIISCYLIIVIIYLEKEKRGWD